MPRDHVVIVGAGMGGLAAAADLARRGAQVTVCERAAAPGGKMRQVPAGTALVDGGATAISAPAARAFTARWRGRSLPPSGHRCWTWCGAWARMACPT